MSGTDLTERLGVLAVGLRAEQAGWAFRELPRPDRGVDAHIEARTDGRPDGRLVALQIKSGESRFREQVQGGWRFYIDASHVEYWRGYSMPVVLVLYSPSRDAAFWQVVNRDTTQSTGEYFAVDVPEGNLFDARSGRDLEGVARADNETADGLRDRRTDVDLPWIWMLDEGVRLFLEWAEQNHPDTAQRTTTEIDAFFAELPAPTATPADEFIAELRAALPPGWAEKAEAIWRAHAAAL